MRSRFVPATTLVLLLVTSGCAGLSSLGDSAPDGGVPSATGSCSVQSVGYDVSVPEKPTPLNESSALALAKDFEKRYKLARIRAEHENVTVDRASFGDVSTTRIDGGYEVTVKLSVHYSTDRLTAKGGYDRTYRIDGERFEQNGRTLACW